MRQLILIIMTLLVITACSEKIGTIRPVEAGHPVQAFFCPKDNCESELIKLVEKAEYSVHCALYDIDLESLISALDQKARSVDVKLVLDSDNYFSQTRSIPVVLDTTSQLSHNKFCIFDNSIISTGSFNPTVNGNARNNNNLVVISSKYLAENFEDEFLELWNNEFGKGNKAKYQSIIFNGREIKNYFCPEDDCAQHLINEILNAKNSIYFMTFSFTDEDVADAILFSNISDIRGIFEKFQAGSQWSQYKRLEEFGLDIRLDNNPGFMHHKVFIIDNETVITGSYNPTSAADNKNDENMLMIHNRKIAQRYISEFINI